MSERLHVVVGILINDQGEILITQRQAHQDLAQCWEFPGGKRESGETPLAALMREFKEEIGIDVISASPWFEQLHDYPNKPVLLDIWFIEKYQGSPLPQEGQPMIWASVSSLDNYQFPEPNRKIVQKLLSSL